MDSNLSQSKDGATIGHSSSVFSARQVLKDFQLKFDNNKAGLQYADANKTTAIIDEASKGSSYYINEQRKAECRQKQILQLRQKAQFFAQCIDGEKNAACRERWELKVRNIERDIEEERHFGNYVHVDMDMFYAAVEMKKDPSLAALPLAVGTSAMLSTANYTARRHGVRPGMPGFIGRKLCPSLVIVPADFDAYRAEAAVVRGIAATYDTHFTSVGLDELTMEVTEHLRQRPGITAADVAAEFRARVFAETRLTASAGIAPTATLAKIASNYKKPDGQHELCLRTREDVMKFIRDLPVRAMPGIGRSMECILQGIGVSSMGDIYDRRVELCYILTEKTFRFLLASSMGVARWADTATEQSTDGVAGADRKSIGMERTFGKLYCRSELQPIVQSAVTSAHATLLEEGLLCQQVVLKVKRTSFQVQQFSKKLLQYTDDLDTLFRAVEELLLPLIDQYASMRLVGVRLTDIITKAAYENQQRQRGGGVQRTLMDFCGQGLCELSFVSAARKAKKHVCKEEVVYSESDDDDDSDADDVVCFIPRKKTKSSESAVPSGNSNDIILID